MPPARRRYRSSGALISQIHVETQTLASNGVNYQKFDDFEHRGSKLVLKKIIADVACVPDTSFDMLHVTFAVIAKPISEGVPVVLDFANEKYMKWAHRCYGRLDDANNTSNPDFAHFVETLKIVVELGWDIFFAVYVMATAVAADYSYWVRLFAKYI